ncbi:unnamed protein product [Plutella xylostella]|uniref:(diamondback moth) hypothetical protein n=1 Tax=Plutella xylostella TaxID=51655 RepID=A0A8S4FU24_PLUXY|nr:unnamed protein product [Plutella xylostella]
MSFYGAPLFKRALSNSALSNGASSGVTIQDDTADLHGVSQPIISTTCKKVAMILAHMSHQFVKMPATLDEQKETMRKFRRLPTTSHWCYRLYSHKSKKINADGSQLYMKRKGYPSINVQVVYDADLKIRDIVTRWHGRVHDSRIYRECRLKQRFEAGAFRGVLLGDDDLQLYTGVTPESFNAAVTEINDNLEIISKWVKSFGLLLNPSKSQAIVLGSSRMLSKIDWTAVSRIQYDQSDIPYVSAVKNLGVIMDSTLSWIPQVDAVSKKMFASFHSLERLQNFLPFNTKITKLKIGHLKNKSFNNNNFESWR